MVGPGILNVNGVPYISLGDAITLARIAHKRGANLEQYAHALSRLEAPKPAPAAPAKKPKPKPKKKTKK